MKWVTNGLMSVGVALCVMVVCGCLSPQTSGMSVEKGKLIIDDASFALNLELREDACERTPEGFLHVQVALKNTNDYDFPCQYQFVWKDGNGLVQRHAKAPWTPIVLHGGEETVLDAVSTIPNSADFRLNLRRIHD